MKNRRQSVALPHRYPFLLLDRVLMVEAGRWAVGLRNLTDNDPLMHSTGQLPPILLAEAMAQTAGVAVAWEDETLRPAFLARIDRFRCRLLAGAGDQLVITAHVRRRFGTTVKVHASVRAGHLRCAAAELVLHFSPRGFPGP